MTPKTDQPATPDVVSIPEMVRSIDRPWNPQDLAQVNEAMLRLVRLGGEFTWHEHDEDELFLCWEGSFYIELADGRQIPLVAGDCVLVPRGVRHRPVAHEPAYALLVVKPETQHAF